MFRTSMFHPHERLQAVRCKIGMWYFAHYSIGPDVMQLYEEQTSSYNLDGRMLDTILYVVGKNDMPL
jgi:hypothetical protein